MKVLEYSFKDSVQLRLCHIFIFDVAILSNKYEDDIQLKSIDICMRNWLWVAATPITTHPQQPLIDLKQV